MNFDNKISPTPPSFRAKREIFMPKNAASKISPFGRNDKVGLGKPLIADERCKPPFGKKSNAAAGMQ